MYEFKPFDKIQFVHIILRDQSFFLFYILPYLKSNLQKLNITHTDVIVTHFFHQKKLVQIIVCMYFFAFTFLSLIHFTFFMLAKHLPTNPETHIATCIHILCLAKRILCFCMYRGTFYCVASSPLTSLVPTRLFAVGFPMFLLYLHEYKYFFFGFAQQFIVLYLNILFAMHRQ